MTRARISRFLLASSALAALAGCHSYHIDVTVENRTGGAIRLLEVDYPTASFGVGSLDSGADYHYRFEVRGSGPVKAQYTAANGQTVQITGPSLTEKQQGQFEMILLPGAKAEFHPQLTPQR